MNQEQEQQVVRGLQDGNADAWRALYDAYCRQVWQLIARMMGPNRADVADVVQETFMAAARSARQYDASRGPLWLWLSWNCPKSRGIAFSQAKAARQFGDAR